MSLRTYGVIPDSSSSTGYKWVEVTTDANGDNTNVYLTTLCQVLLLGRGESPFYANYGIPAIQSVQTGVPPDLYVMQTQAQFAPFFASLTIVPSKDSSGNPVYDITAVAFSGAILTAQIAT